MSFVFNAIQCDFRRLHDAPQSEINDSHRISLPLPFSLSLYAGVSHKGTNLPPPPTRLPYYLRSRQFSPGSRRE